MIQQSCHDVHRAKLLFFHLNVSNSFCLSVAFAHWIDIVLVEFCLCLKSRDLHHVDCGETSFGHDIGNGFLNAPRPSFPSYSYCLGLPY